MLPLDSRRWWNLQHAYGLAAEDTSAPTGWSATGFHGYQKIPNVIQCLRHLEAKPQRLPETEREPWETLISSLCHQGGIYSASFAAVPHIIEIGLRSAAKQEIDYRFFLLPTMIEQARLDGQMPQCDDDIVSDYLAAVSRLHELAHAVRDHSWPFIYSVVVTAALAVSKGHLQLSKCLLECGEERRVGEMLDWLYEH